MNDFISKTGQVTPPDSVSGNRKKNIPGLKGDNTFNRMLSGHLLLQEADKALTQSENKQVSSLSEIQSPFKIPLAGQNFDLQAYAQKLSSSIDLLDAYAAVLNDPTQTLKQASGLLDQLLGQLQGLEQEFQDADKANNELSAILVQLTTTARLEKIKLDRGDYLS